jgi:hypothetical protein
MDMGFRDCRFHLEPVERRLKPLTRFPLGTEVTEFPPSEVFS